jgi:hypothetical protein
MLGHLSYEEINPEVDGLKKPVNHYVNYYQGDSYSAYNMPKDVMLPFDVEKARK